MHTIECTEPDIASVDNAVTLCRIQVLRVKNSLLAAIRSTIDGNNIAAVSRFPPTRLSINLKQKLNVLRIHLISLYIYIYINL
jgi:hypothetical protein